MGKKIKPELQEIVDKYERIDSVFPSCANKWAIKDKRAICSAVKLEKQFEEELEDENEDIVLTRALKKLQRMGYIENAIVDKRWWQKLNEFLENYVEENSVNKTKREKRTILKIYKIIAYTVIFCFAFMGCLIVFGMIVSGIPTYIRMWINSPADAFLMTVGAIVLITLGYVLGGHIGYFPNYYDWF